MRSEVNLFEAELKKRRKETEKIQYPAGLAFVPCPCKPRVLVNSESMGLQYSYHMLSHAEQSTVMMQEDMKFTRLGSHSGGSISSA